MEQPADAISREAPYSRVLSTMSEEIERLTFERDAISAAIESLERAARSLGSVSLVSPPRPLPLPAGSEFDPPRSHHKVPASASDGSAPRKSHHKAPAPGKEPVPPARSGRAPVAGTIRSRVRDLLASDPQQSWSAVDLVAALRAEGLAGAVDPDAAMRTLLARLLGNGQIERRDRGLYGAISRR